MIAQIKSFLSKVVDLKCESLFNYIFRSFTLGRSYYWRTDMWFTTNRFLSSFNIDFAGSDYVIQGDFIPIWHENSSTNIFQLKFDIHHEKMNDQFYDFWISQNEKTLYLLCMLKIQYQLCLKYLLNPPIRNFSYKVI